MGLLEIPTKCTPALVEETPLLVPSAVGGPRVVPEGQEVAGGAVRVVIVPSKTLWTDNSGLHVAKGPLTFAIITPTAP